MIPLLILAEGQQPEGAPAIMSMVPVLLVGLLFVFMVLAPNRKQEKKRKEMLTKLKKGDRIVNSGGLIGIVDAVKDKEDEVLLKGGVKITRSSVVRIEEETKDAAN